MVVLICFVAVMVPFFGLVMEFVGAVCLTMIVFVLPVVFSYKLRGDSMTFAEKIWGVCIIFAGLVGGTIGGIQSIISIVDLLKAGAIQ
jgi:amino acid permease